MNCDLRLNSRRDQRIRVKSVDSQCWLFVSTVESSEERIAAWVMPRGSDRNLDFCRLCRYSIVAIGNEILACVSYRWNCECKNLVILCESHHCAPVKLESRNKNLGGFSCIVNCDQRYTHALHVRIIVCLGLNQLDSSKKIYWPFQDAAELQIKTIAGAVPTVGMNWNKKSPLNLLVHSDTEFWAPTQSLVPNECRFAGLIR